MLKALSSNSKCIFAMNFQQIKLVCCDVFVWIAVWRDVIHYLVISSDEVNNNRHYSATQHRGNVGEGQLCLKNSNIYYFIEFEVSVRDILSKIVEKAGKSTNINIK